MGRCRVLISFNQLMAAVVVPTLLSAVFSARHGSWAPADEADAAAPPASQCSASAWRSPLSAAAGAVARCWAAAEAALQGTAAALSPWEAALVLLLLSGNLWMDAKLALLGPVT